MSNISIRLEELTNRTYFTKLAMQRYNIPAARLRYILDDSAIVEETDNSLVEVLIKCYAHPAEFPLRELRSFPIVTILDYLRRTHVLYTYKRLPEIGQAIGILRSEAEDAVLLKTLDTFFRNYSRHLLEHIEEEESQLFFYISKLLKLQEEDEIICRDVVQPGFIQSLTENHNDTEEDLFVLRKVLRTYVPSAVNETPYRMLMSRLKNFELDLMLHARIEDDVLVPGALELENELIARC